MPGQWKSAHTTPVPKEGESELIESYRHDTQTAVCILQPNEFGFRPGHCTQDMLVKYGSQNIQSNRRGRWKIDTICLPYIQGLSEDLERAVRDLNIRAVFKTTLTLRR